EAVIVPASAIFSLPVEPSRLEHLKARASSVTEDRPSVQIDRRVGSSVLQRGWVTSRRPARQGERSPQRTSCVSELPRTLHDPCRGGTISGSSLSRPVGSFVRSR